MKTFKWIHFVSLAFAAAATISLTSPILFAAETVPPLDQSALEATWKGHWSDTKGYFYTAEAHWTVKPDGTVEGYFDWTLKRSPRPAEQKKIGITAREFLHGRFLPDCRVLSLDGYKKDDPQNVIGNDKYRLYFSENRKALAGPTAPTWDNDDWTGVLSLSR